MENLSGQVVQGYDLLERIGAGGFGAVYRAFQSTVGREVAVKVILPAYANKPQFIRRFEIEAQLVARLEHLHIVPLYDYWRDPHGAYIVMRWLRGGSLSEALRQGAFDLEAASNLLDQVAAGLAAAHYQQIVHRDIKPSNILLDDEGNAYLADFGIARVLRQAKGTNGSSNRKNNLDSESSDQFFGSIKYLAPEQLRGQDATPQSDIYSLGVTLYEVLAGRHPFPESNSFQQLYEHSNEPLPRIENLERNVIDDVNAVIQKATAQNPGHRFQDALALAGAFRASARINRDREPVDLNESLTRREQEILKLMVEGSTNKQIAQDLYLELSTVKWHINHIYKKLGVRSRVQAAVRARQLDLIVANSEADLQPAQDSKSSIVLPEPINPYKGLRAFELADNRDFFGRETFIEQLLTRLGPVPAGSGDHAAQDLVKNRTERFLAIVGPSGSGKSSLIKAGLIPALWTGRLVDSEKWFIIDMVPGARPLDGLEIALTRIAADQADNLRGHLNQDHNGLVRAAQLILPNDQSELLLVIDQFEELFTLVEDEPARSHFMDLIQSAVTDPHSRVRVLIALRADYYDRPLQYPIFGDLVRGHLETLLPLSAEELERAIVNPAHQAGVTFEQGLVATIIEDVNYRPGALPLLQFVLAELFEQRDGRLLTQNAYYSLGGVAGALARRAEDLYQEYDAEGREAIHQMFLRLVSVAEQLAGAASEYSLAADTRRRVLRSELLSAAADPEQLDEIIDTFANYRLLSLDHDSASRQATVEVAHEAILREWGRLQGWLEESLLDLSLHRQLIRIAGQWLMSGRDQSFLLHGTRLDKFEKWANDTPLILTQDERAYLEAGIAWREELAAAQRERQEQKARIERQSNRRLKALIGLMAVALVVAVGLAVAAVSFARQAEEQRSFAEEQQGLAEEQRSLAEEQQGFAEEQQGFAEEQRSLAEEQQGLAEEQRSFAEEQQRLATVRELIAAASVNLNLDPERSVLLALEAVKAAFSSDGTVLFQAETVLRQAIQADRVLLSIPIDGRMAYTSDGKILAIGGENGRLTLWNAETGQWIRRLDGHHSLITDLAFSQNGQILATSSLDSSVKIWQIHSGRLLGILPTGQPVKALTLKPDANQVAAVLQDGGIQVWDIETILPGSAEESEPVFLREPALQIETPSTAASVAFTPEGERLAAVIPNRSIFLWDPQSGQQLLEIEGAGDSAAISFSPDGEYLAAGSSSADVAVWDSRTGEELLLLQEPSPASDVQFSQSGDSLSTAAADGTVTLWDVNTGRQLIRFPGWSEGTNNLVLRPDGQQLAAEGADGSIRIWDLDFHDSADILSIAAHEGQVYDAIYNPDGTEMASTGTDGALKVWDSATGAPLLSLPGRIDDVFFPAYSPDGKRLAAANREGGVSVWDAGSGEQLLAVQGNEGAFTTVAFSPDGAQLAAAGKDGGITIWDAASGERLASFNNGSGISRLVYELGGKHLWTFDWKGFVTTWNAISSSEFQIGSKTISRTIFDSDLGDAVLTRDGRLWAAAGSDGLHVYETDDDPLVKPYYTLLYTLRNHTGKVAGTAFNPDGTILASSSFDGSVKLWDINNGQELFTLTEQPLPVNGVDISPDGTRLVTAGADGKVREYILSIEDLVDVAQSHLSRGLTREECQKYLHLPSCPTE